MYIHKSNKIIIIITSFLLGYIISDISFVSFMSILIPVLISTVISLYFFDISGRNKLIESLKILINDISYIPFNKGIDEYRKIDNKISYFMKIYEKDVKRYNFPTIKTMQVLLHEIIEKYNNIDIINYYFDDKLDVYKVSDTKYSYVYCVFDEQGILSLKPNNEDIIKTHLNKNNLKKLNIPYFKKINENIFVDDVLFIRLIYHYFKTNDFKTINEILPLYYEKNEKIKKIKKEISIKKEILRKKYEDLSKLII